MLLIGPSGAGKSTLALALGERGWRLVADDRTLVWRSGDALYGRAPATLSGLVEVRGTGVLSASRLPWVGLRLAVALTGGEPDRIPEPASLPLLGTTLPLFSLDPRSPGARAACALLVAGLTPLTGGVAGV